MQELLRNPITLWSGAIATLICCFTPVLAGLFTLVGLGASVGYLDYALMPLLGFFITALARVYTWRNQAQLAWGGGALVLAVLAIFFGRFNLVFPVLIGAGTVLAVLAYRKRGADNE